MSETYANSIEVGIFHGNATTHGVCLVRFHSLYAQGERYLQ